MRGYRWGFGLLGLWALSAAAQLPGMGVQEGAGAPVAASAPSGGPSIERLRQALSQDRALLRRLDAPGGLALGAPPEVGAAALEERRIRLAFNVSMQDQQLNDLEQLAGARQQRRELEARVAAWHGFDVQPPYSVQLVDRLRLDVAAAQRQLDAVSGRQTLLETFGERSLESVRQSEARVRQLAERAEAEGAHQRSELVQWEQDLARLQARSAQLAAAVVESTRAVQRETLGIARVSLQFAQRKLAQAEAHYQFSDEDYANERAALDAESRRLDAQRTALSESREVRERELEGARRALAASKPETSSARQQTLKGALDVAEARLAAVNARLELLRSASDALRVRALLWDVRYKGLRGERTAMRLDARKTLDGVSPYLSMWRRTLERQRESQEGLLRLLDAQNEEIEGDGRRNEIAARRTASTEVLDTLRQSFSALDTLEALADNVALELGVARQQLSAQERVDEWSLRTRRWLDGVWGYEIFSVQDVIEVDGVQVTGSRSITVGKVVYALLLFGVGCLTCVVFARLIARVLVARFGWNKARASILRRWLLTIEFVILFVIVLAWAKIPLTAFAFLGGAIAIGAGFGMQTMLKNLMSGVMILGERPFRPGDYIEIAGTAGTVVDIGIRATTIKNINGIETIIPNATFVEENLTNWTYSSPQVRFSVRIGVAYGSPVRQVSELLHQAALRHGVVLKSPEPEVLFEDFGDDALIFSLNYWLEMGPNVAGRIVASDLRRMIEASFAEAGIVIAYPQRDVHLDAAAPIPVRVVGAEG